MNKSMIIFGGGNIGRHMCREFAALNPDIYDPFLPDYSEKADKRYGFAFICVPTDGLPDGSCDTSVVESAVKEANAEIIVIKSTVPPGTTERLIKETGENDSVFARELRHDSALRATARFRHTRRGTRSVRKSRGALRGSQKRIFPGTFH